MPTTKAAVGFIGLGDQGAPIAQAIADGGYPPHVWARRPESLRTLGGYPHTAHSSAAELAAASDIIGLRLSQDADNVQVAVNGTLLENMCPGAVLVNHGTGLPQNVLRSGSATSFAPQAIGPSVTAENLRYLQPFELIDMQLFNGARELDELTALVPCLSPIPPMASLRTRVGPGPLWAAPGTNHRTDRVISMSEAAAERKPRPRNAAATKALLLNAATEEFAEYGLAGARIDRIAERAGVNKRLLYVYFGDKNQLFDAVVQEQTDAVLKAAPMDDGDLCAFATARFDFVLANPEARRIAAWRVFEQTEPTEAERRAYRTRIEAVEKAQAAGKIRTDISATDLFAFVLRITESWLSAPPALQATSGKNPLSPQRLQEHRAALRTAVRSLIDRP